MRGRTFDQRLSFFGANAASFPLLSANHAAGDPQMDEGQLAQLLSEKLLSDTKFWIAIVGIIGGIVGACLTILGNVALHWLKEKPNRDFDNRRKRMLKQMLDDSQYPDKWRSLSSLSTVIGASEEDTKRLLIELGARGSHVESDKWGLIKNHPLTE
jgi:hypothetical protein